MAQPEFAQHGSLPDLIRGILTDLRTLIREEFALARVEIREEVGRLRTAAIGLGVAVVALVFGGTFLLIAIALGIAFMLNWPAWCGFLVMALLLAVTGALTFRSSRKRLARLHALPTEAVSTLKENSEWLAKRLSSVRK